MEKEVILNILNLKNGDLFSIKSLLLNSISQNDIDNNNLINLYDYLLVKKILLIQKIENEFNIEIKDEEFEYLNTLEDLVNIIKQKKSWQNNNQF